MEATCHTVLLPALVQHQHVPPLGPIHMGTDEDQHAWSPFLDTSIKAYNSDGALLLCWRELAATHRCESDDILPH